MDTTGERKPIGRNLREFSAEMQADLEALPHSAAFEQVMEDYKVEQSTLLQSTVRYDIHTSLLPNELQEAFYFPSIATVSDIRAVLQEDRFRDNDTVDNVWLLTMQFLLNGRLYVLTVTDSQAKLMSENSEGGSSTHLTTPSIASQLIAGLITESIPGKNEDEESLSEDYTDTLTSIGFRNQLMILGHLVGESRSTVTAHLPYEYGDRVVIARTVETESTDSNGAGLEIDLGWELFDTATEISLINRIVKDHDKGIEREVVYGEIGDTKESIDDFLTFKQMPGLFKETEAVHARTVNRKDPQWKRLAVMFMVTIGPLLERYRELDQVSFEDDPDHSDDDREFYVDEPEEDGRDDDLDEDGFNSPNPGAA